MQLNTQNLITAVEENLNRLQANPDLLISNSRIGQWGGVQFQIMATRKQSMLLPKFHTHEAISQGELDQDLDNQVIVPRLMVTFEDYAEAVERLLKLAEGDTGGSLAAAGLLLSLYNSHLWRADMVAVSCSLDEKNRHAALVAIQGRGKLMREPQNVVENGPERFYALAEQWKHLKTKRK